MRPLLSLLPSIISIVIIIFCIMILRIPREHFLSEARLYQNADPTYGIAQCRYQGYTPILTCSYESKV